MPPPTKPPRPIQALAHRTARALTAAVGQGEGRLLLAALSGGPDSAALLFLLKESQPQHGWPLRAAHIDHGIQAAPIRQSFRDTAQAAADLAEVPLDIVEVDAPAEAAARGAGLEAAARSVRYQALTQLAQQHHAAAVATAHTRDDQAETVLLHLLRGSGLDGLSGIPQQRALSRSVQLVRPLLGMTRSDTEAVCRASRFPPVHDPANADPHPTRNRIRRDLLPHLQEFNPRITERLATLAATAAEDRALLEEITAAALAQVQEDATALNRRRLLALSPPLRRRVLRQFCTPLSAERTAAALQA